MFGYFDYQKLGRIAEEQGDSYREADPFPHIVVDEFADDRKLHHVLQDFPKPDDLKWWSYDNHFEKKLAFDKIEELHLSIKHILCEMNSAPFITFLEKLTGIDGLISDPHFAGGGLHQIKAGGVLKLHADFNLHRKMNLDRRINVLLYLNKFWEDSYGGRLELWDHQIKKCYNKILPIFNRMVCFSTTDFSIHGHPHPLTCPPDKTRKSIALYYYTNGRPESEKTEPHSTIYHFNPEEAVTPELEAMRQQRMKGRLIDETK